MKFIKILFSKYKIYTSIFVIIILLIISYLIYIKRSNEVIAVDNNINDIFNKESEEVKNIDNYNKIKVDIKGMVNNPGVYELDENSRVIDQTTPNMIQRINGIFERKPLISKEI